MKVKIGRGKVKIVKHRFEKKKKRKKARSKKMGVLESNSSLSTLHFSPLVSKLSSIETRNEISMKDRCIESLVWKLTRERSIVK